MVHLQGLEPWAHWLRVSCSTNWARGSYYQDAVSNILITMSRRPPIFTSSFQLTILGTSELNYCVRNGNRWDLTVIVTDHMTGSVYHTVYCLSSISRRTCLQNWIITAHIFSLTQRVSSELWSSPRSISTHLLNGSLHLHIVPINLVVFKGSYLI